MPPVTVPLPSSWIETATYDPDDQTLDIATRSGRTYSHANVPASVFEDFTNASSPGRFYLAEIKDRY